MATKEKQIQVLSNDKEIKTTKEGWDTKDVAELPVLIAGWKPGQSSHHPVGLGMILAFKDKVEGAYLGDFEAEGKDGKPVMIPVMDPLVVNQAMKEASIKEYDLDVKEIRIATNRANVATQKLADVKTAVEGMDEALLETLKVEAPDVYAKLTGL